ncbi:HEAT repeat domain-containing protein [Bradyrhizobium sp. C-145]|uniref:HEAT repeat domain-containing protein n=1 Tax=Bradyrhizobium sp. C-145 TaxID=574727 RepID=UPI00201B5B5C|nr:HEAT repeat domain-containing protein [Bradyrhizobium sp. C-145]UQR61330.1 HEAT repeat domain-containing protein [Bradyrhizobium sp. C-145]
MAGSSKGGTRPGQAPVREAVGSIIPFLDHQLPSLRKDAAAALGEIADPSARDALVARSRDDDPDVRKTVSWALGQIRARVSP